MRRILAAAAAVVIGLSGCSGATQDIRTETRTQLQQDVMALSQAAAAKKYAEAQRALTTLEADLAAALAAGDISGERAAEIRAAAALIQSDLAKLLRTPAPTVTVSAPSSSKKNDKKSEENRGETDKKGETEKKGDDD